MAPKGSERPRKQRNPEETRAALLDAAWEEFEEPGFEATNTNRIARRAGYAPQTFYRHFEDKRAIFLAVYARWVDEEFTALTDIRDADKVAGIIIRHHRKSLRFRRALRALSVADDAVRKARAESRRAQIKAMKELTAVSRKLEDEKCTAALLTIERLADACAEGEFKDLGLPARAGQNALAELLARELGMTRAS